MTEPFGCKSCGGMNCKLCWDDVLFTDTVITKCNHCYCELDKDQIELNVAVNRMIGNLKWTCYAC